MSSRSELPKSVRGIGTVDVGVRGKERVVATVSSHVKRIENARGCAFDGFAERWTTQGGWPGFGSVPPEPSKGMNRKIGYFGFVIEEK